MRSHLSPFSLFVLDKFCPRGGAIFLSLGHIRTYDDSPTQVSSNKHKLPLDIPPDCGIIYP